MRRQNTAAVRQQRMSQFDAYVRVLLDNPDQAVAYEELDEDALKFVITLRGAFQRAGHTDVMVRTVRARDEAPAWFPDRGDETPASPAEPAPEATETATAEQALRRRRAPAVS